MTLSTCDCQFCGCCDFSIYEISGHLSIKFEISSSLMLAFILNSIGTTTNLTASLTTDVDMKLIVKQISDYLICSD